MYMYVPFFIFKLVSKTYVYLFFFLGSRNTFGPFKTSAQHVNQSTNLVLP